MSEQGSIDSMIGGLSFATVGGMAGATVGGLTDANWGMTGAAGAGGGFALGFFTSLVMVMLFIYLVESRLASMQEAQDPL